MHYDTTVEYGIELLAYKVQELIKIIDESKLDMDNTTDSSHKHALWLTKFFQMFKTIHKMEKHKRQEPKLFNSLYVLGSFLRKR
jgi:hypothetical protein